MIDDQSLDHGISERYAAASIVAIPACTRLLAVTTQFTDLVEQVAVAHAGLAQMRARLAIAPAYIQTGQVAHREWAHGETKFV